MIFALLAAASTAGYTVWDKYAIGYLDTFLYFAGYTVLLGALVRRRRCCARLAPRFAPRGAGIRRRSR